MKGKLLGLLPSIRWIPHDLPSAQESHKAKHHRTIFSRRATTAEPDHGAPPRRKSTLSLNEMPDAEVDARTHAQGQSAFFARLPLEVRKMVYEFVMGAETVHLTLGAKRRFGHFVCETGGGEEEGECTCRVLVGGGHRHGGRLSGACVRVLRVCRRM